MRADCQREWYSFGQYDMAMTSLYCVIWADLYEKALPSISLHVPRILSMYSSVNIENCVNILFIAT
jgi:hypothetical protein